MGAILYSNYMLVELLVSVTVSKFEVSRSILKISIALQLNCSKCFVTPCAKAKYFNRCIIGLWVSGLAILHKITMTRSTLFDTRLRK